VIVFKPLTVEDYTKIADLMLKETREALSERGVAIDWDETALQRIAEKAHGQRYGARDIRRVLRDDVEDKIAELIVSGEIAPASIHIRGTEEGVSVDPE